MKRILKKIIPGFLLGFYYLSLEWLAALRFGFPSRGLTVIGVTGTNGKTTVVELLAHLLHQNGYPVASISSLYFRTKGIIQKNRLKMTLPSRAVLQGFIRQAQQAGVEYLILEVTSEGIKQFRQRFIDFNGAVFTNLTPEHIEAHGGFENYKQAKGRLFQKLASKPGSFAVVNLDDKHAGYFLSFPIERKYGYSLKKQRAEVLAQEYRLTGSFAPEALEKTKSGFQLRLGGWELAVNLKGEFNVLNALAAVGAARVMGLGWQEIHKGLDSFRGVAGRLEEIDEGQAFRVIVDYAHTPDALTKVYETLVNSKSETLNPKQIQNSNDPDSKRDSSPRLRSARNDNGGRLIAVLGSAGGGRDKWKRPELGKIAASYADIIILTNEDPYDEEPSQILEDIAQGIANYESRIQQGTAFEILDRKEAIEKAIELAQPGDTVVITGKGAEPLMALERGRKIDWDDRVIARQAIQAKQAALGKAEKSQEKRQKI